MPGPLTFPAGGNVPAGIALSLLSQGASTPISLLELQLIDGARLYLSDAAAHVVPLLAQFDLSLVRSLLPMGGGVVPPPAIAPTLARFLPWLIDIPTFRITDTLVTQTASCSFQNIGGDTVNRDGSRLFAPADFWGALFLYRLWLPADEYALFTTKGTVGDVSCSEDQVDLALKSWLNFSEITAPDCEIGPSCQNQFGSQQCGSTSPTPCQNTYGTCTQINRFKGLITSWNVTATTPAAATPIAQPLPPVALNPRRTA